MTFAVVIREESGRFWAEVPDLPGCFTQGASYDETLSNAREAVEGHLAAMAENGYALPAAVNVRVGEVEVKLPVPVAR